MRVAWLALCCISGLYACGGGGDSSDPVAQNPDPLAPGPGTPPPSSGSGTAELSWNAPSTHEDGSAFTDLVGYRIRYGTAPGVYPNTIPVGSNLTTYVIDNLPPATYYFVVSAVDSQGTESRYSSPVSKTIS